jgi:iron(III) transport system substrate-binding protein
MSTDPIRRGPVRSPALRFIVLAVAALVAGCSTSAAPPPATATITLYTSVQQPVVDAVLTAFAAVRPDVQVELFRAPTGELSARIAAELREGRVRGDVLWLTDPPSMQGWADQGVLREWTPTGAAALDPADRTDSFWGTRILNMVIVKGSAVSPGPVDWGDLADPVLRDAVAIPDPGFAGSAFGALSFFALHPDYGFGYYERLEANGAVQVRSPDEVTTGVAEGRFKAGITLDSSARAAVDKGSPVELVWPASGAVAMYGPVAVVDGSDQPAAAQAFVEYLLSADGQGVLGRAGQEPVLANSGGPRPAGVQVRPEWSAVFGRQEELLERYRGIFGG